MGIIICITLLVAIVILSEKVSKWQESNLEKAREPINKRINEYEQKLKIWCEQNSVTFKERISDWEEIRVNYLPGYIWFSNKDFVFCPDAINCGNPINIDENIIFIKYENIKHYSKDGTVSYTNEIVNNGKNISISGAVIGGLIAGETGAIIGSKKDMNQIKNVTVTHDSIHTYIYYEDNGEIKLLDIQGKDFYESILHKMPEKEYYYLLNKKNI